jgi:flavodoxin
MTSLVIYDSLFGNTKKVAETIAEELKGKAVNIRDFKNEMLEGISLLIVGSPINGWRPTKSITKFLSSLPAESLKGINTAAFDTRIEIFFSGDASGKIDKLLASLGGKSISKPGKFYVKGKEGPLIDGELENVKFWAKEIRV